MSNKEILDLLQSQTEGLYGKKVTNVARAIWERYMEEGQSTDVMTVSIPTLASESGVDVKDVFKAIVKLEDSELFEWELNTENNNMVGQFHIKRDYWESFARTSMKSLQRKIHELIRKGEEDSFIEVIDKLNKAKNFKPKIRMAAVKRLTKDLVRIVL